MRHRTLRAAGSILLGLLLTLGATGCGDDDGGTNDNNLNNNSVEPGCGNGVVDEGVGGREKPRKSIPADRSGVSA